VSTAWTRRSSWRTGPQPRPGGLLPVQRKLGELRRRDPVRGSGGSTRLCSRAVLVAEVDERCLVQSLTASGSSPPASCSEGEGAPEAGPRWQNRGHGGGLTTIPFPRTARREGPGERALVEGRRPGLDEAIALDGVVVETSLAAPPGGPGRKAGSRSSGSCDRGRQRLCHGLGARTRTPPPGGAARRGLRSRLRQDRAALVPVLTHVRGQHPGRVAAQAARTLDATGHAEAGGSPSSEAPPGDPHSVFGRRRLGRAWDRSRKGAGQAKRSGIGQSAGCSYRRLVAEVGETHLSRRHSRASGQPEGSGEVG
jgi:hypothetical protein